MPYVSKVSKVDLVIKLFVQENLHIPILHITFISQAAVHLVSNSRKFITLTSTEAQLNLVNNLILNPLFSIELYRATNNYGAFILLSVFSHTLVVVINIRPVYTVLVLKVANSPESIILEVKGSS